MNPLPPKPRVYLENNPTVTRLVPELAAVIGLNESILFLQIDFWIGQSEHFYEGCYWTFQSVRDMRKKAFPFWSIATINRTVVSLEAQHLVTVGNFNKRKGDTTRWFALNTEGIEKLSAKVPCITMIQGVYQNETPLPKDEIAREDLFQNDTPLYQNETTLPEITTYKDKDKEIAPAVADAPALSLVEKPTVPDEKVNGTVKTKETPIPAALINPMKDAIVSVFAWEWDRMTDNEIGMVQTAAKQLCKAKRTPEDVAIIHRYCVKQGWTGFKPTALPGAASEALKHRTTRNAPKLSDQFEGAPIGLNQFTPNAVPNGKAEGDHVA